VILIVLAWAKNLILVKEILLAGLEVFDRDAHHPVEMLSTS
jgi:hypothetical protein